jgi:hypothetical protein
MGTDCGAANALSLDGLGLALNAALNGTPFQFPQAVSHQDDSSPFRIDATLGRWQIDESGSGNRIEITIASGTLRDIDKGIFLLSGMIVTLLVAAEMTPAAVVNPGPLSELQQEGLLDAVGTYLNPPAIQYAIATVALGSGGSENPATLPGLLVSLQNGSGQNGSGQNASNSPAALLISGDLFVSRAVLPGLTAPGLTAPGLAGALGDFSLLSCSMSIVAEKLLTTAQLRRTSSEGIEQTFTARCSHSARFDAASRKLLFVSEDTNSSEPAVDGAVRALANAIAAAASKSIARVELPRDPEPSFIKPSVASPATATFHIHTAALAGAVCLQGNWS